MVLSADTDDTPVWSSSVAADGHGGFRKRIRVTRPGYYTLRVSGAPATTFAVTPTRPIAVNGLQVGVCTHFGQRPAPAASYALLHCLGVDYVRDELLWDRIEQSRGTFRFPAGYDEYLSRLRRRGIKLLWVAGYGNPLYPGSPVNVPEGAEAFGDYVVQGLKRYGDEMLAVEVLNEPNKVEVAGVYLPILRSTWSKMRGSGFLQPVIGVGGAGIGGGINPDFAERLFAAGGAAYCDGFSQHPYTSPYPPDLGYPINDGSGLTASLDLALTRAQSLLSHYGKRDGSWITEIGWPAPSAVSEPKQAAFIARALLTASGYPSLRGVAAYDFQDDGLDPQNNEHHFGLVRQDLTPKPAFQAYAVAAAFLRGKQFVRKIRDDRSALWGNVYRDATGKYWVACWATEVPLSAVAQAGPTPAAVPARYGDIENRVAFVLGVGKARASAFDWQGRPLKMAPRMTATSRPLYIDTGLLSDTVVLQPAK